MDVLEKYGSTLVTCPMEGQDHEAQRLDIFMESEIGQRVLGEAVANVAVLVEAGIEEDKALRIALGGALVKDEDDNIMRAPEPVPVENTAERTVYSAESAEPKKKDLSLN